MPSVTSLPVPTYGVTFAASDLELSVDSLIKGLQVSSLVVAQSRISLVFRLDDDVNPTAVTEGNEKVVSIDYRGIIVHGISAAAAAAAAAPVEGGYNDSTAAAAAVAASSNKKSFYLMLRGNWRREFEGLKGLSSLSIADCDEEEEREIGEEEEEELEEAFLTEEDEDLSVTEIHLTPSDASQLEVINESVAACLESHREVEEEEEEEEEDDVEEEEEEEEEDDVEEEEKEAEAIVKDAEVAAPESSSSSSSSLAPFWGSNSIPSVSPVIPGEKISVVPALATDRHPGHPEDARLARLELHDDDVNTVAAGAAINVDAVDEWVDAVDNHLGEAKTELPMEEEMTHFGLLTQRRLNTLLAANYFRGDEVAAC